MMLTGVDKAADPMALLSRADRAGGRGQVQVGRGGPDVGRTEKHCGRRSEGLDLAVKWISSGFGEADTPGYRWNFLSRDPP